MLFNYVHLLFLYGVKNYFFAGLTSIKGISFRTGLETNSMVCCGPMSKYAEDLDPFLRVMIGNKIGQLQLDAKVILCIGLKLI